MTPDALKSLVETASDCAARKAVAGLAGNRQAPGSNGWLRDNLRMILLLTAGMTAVSTIGGYFLVSSKAFASHQSSLTPHPQAEAVQKLMQKHHEERMGRLESESRVTRRMLVQSTAPSRREKVQAIADEDETTP